MLKPLYSLYVVFESMGCHLSPIVASYNEILLVNIMPYEGILKSKNNIIGRIEVSRTIVPSGLIVKTGTGLPSTFLNFEFIKKNHSK